jgi:hypothetical protein
MERLERNLDSVPASLVGNENRQFDRAPMLEEIANYDGKDVMSHPALHARPATTRSERGREPGGAGFATIKEINKEINSKVPTIPPLSQGRAPQDGRRRDSHALAATAQK